MQSYRCLEACERNPLVMLDHNAPYTIRDLLLSKTAVGPHVTFNEVAKAIDELIDLNYALINRILEISAFHCAIGRLFIYCANPSEFESLKLDADNQGYFNEANGLIVVSTRLPLSQLLIHEFTHAVRYSITLTSDELTKRHRAFCKHTFLPFFRQAIKNSGPTWDEKEQLDYLKKSYDTLSSLMLEKARRCSGSEWNKTIDGMRESSRVFFARTQKVKANEQFRKDFYDCFKLYKESEFAKEFLSLFLERFVRAAYHEKVTSLESWLVDYMRIPEDNMIEFYHAYLLEMMWSSLPSTIVESFVIGDFRTALDNYVAKVVKPFFYNKPIELKDNEFYSISFAEPNRIKVTRF